MTGRWLNDRLAKNVYMVLKNIVFVRVVQFYATLAFFKTFMNGAEPEYRLIILRKPVDLRPIYYSESFYQC